MDEQKTPELTPEERLQYYYGIRPGTIGTGCPDVFDILPPEKRPVFTFKVLTATQQQDFQDQFYVDGVLPKDKIGKAIRHILDLTLIAWTGYTDQDGNEIPFERLESVITDACYACVALPLRSALFSMILSRNTLSKKEAVSVK